MKIEYSLKRKCAEAFKSGMTYKQIYDDIFLPKHKGMSFQCFKVKCSEWKKKIFADDTTLDAGTYPDFLPHGATVQVNGNGEIVQAWIKQNADIEEQFQKLIEEIRSNTQPVPYVAKEIKAEKRMLEISLYDMHFGLPNDYDQVLDELLDAIDAHYYDEINIVMGQDMFHNDDFRGRTAKGTQIEKIDIVNAWNDARNFWFNAINKALEQTENVNIIYIKGNHDESLCWAFVQMLKEMFPSVHVDDSLKKRKAIYWQGCFVGFTHGEEKRSSINDLRGQFTIRFPQEFADATVREIHCGHLHQEKEADTYGVMCRRLSTANIEDDWSDDSGFIGAHKRFMLFEWMPGRLKTINYIGG